MKKIINWLLLVLTGKCEKAVDAGICNYSGQGRDAYGK
jgi:hypothetical protein